MKLQNTIKNALSTGLILAIVFLNLPSARAESNINQTNNPVVSNLQIPFNQTAFVTIGDSSEFVDFTGNIHLVVKYIPTDPILPPNPIRVHTNVMNVTGIGQTSGLSYRLNGTTNFNLPGNIPGDFSFGTSYRLLPPNPIRESSLNVSYLVSLNSDGAVTAAEAFAGVVEE